MPDKPRAASRRQPRKHRRDVHPKGGRRRLEVTYGPELGPGIVQASIDEVMAAFRAHGDDLDWPSVASNVLPVIPRVRHYPSGSPEALRTMVPPGILVGFGIDIGPAFMNVSEELLQTWSISVGDLTAAAIANVHRRAATLDRSAIHVGALGGYTTEWLQTGVSIGSTLVVAPTELRRLFGGPRFFITPMRDLIIGFPPDVERDAALWLHHEIGDLDPNCLGPMGYSFDGVRVLPVALEAAAGPGVPAMPRSPGSSPDISQ